MGWRICRLAVLAALKMRLNLNCPLAFVPGYLVLNWMESEDPSTDTTGMDGSEGKPGGGGGSVNCRIKSTRVAHCSNNKRAQIQLQSTQMTACNRAQSRADRVALSL